MLTNTISCLKRQEVILRFVEPTEHASMLTQKLIDGICANNALDKIYRSRACEGLKPVISLVAYLIVIWRIEYSSLTLR